MYVPLRHARTAECNRSIRKINTQLHFLNQAVKAQPRMQERLTSCNPRSHPQRMTLLLIPGKAEWPTFQQEKISSCNLSTHQVGEAKGGERAGRGLINTTPGRTASNKQPLCSNMSLSHGDPVNVARSRPTHPFGHPEERGAETCFALLACRISFSPSPV
ncbi:hypothetical protein V2G26_006577 [Clonostachys chloroleuca]